MIAYLLRRDPVLKAALVVTLLAPLALLPIPNQNIFSSGILAVLAMSLFGALRDSPAAASA